MAPILTLLSQLWEGGSISELVCEEREHSVLAEYQRNNHESWFLRRAKYARLWERKISAGDGRSTREKVSLVYYDELRRRSRPVHVELMRS